MSLNQPTARPVLSIVSDSNLNIRKKYSSDFPKLPAKTSTPLSARLTENRTFDDIVNKHSEKIPVKRSISDRERMGTLNSTSDVELSPKLKRARLLKMKLKLAYFKVKTNQTDIPLTSLKLPEERKAKENIFNRASKPKSLALKKKSIDYVVAQKGASAISSRFSLNQNYIEHITNAPLSAPATILTFNQRQFKHNHSASVTSPSKFLISNTVLGKRPLKQTLPPVSKIFGIGGSTNYNSTSALSNKQSLLSHSTNIPADLTVDEKNEEKDVNETTILQNDTTSTPLPRRRHSIEQMERNNDPDLTILQSNNSILMSTPVRQQPKSSMMRKSRSCDGTTPNHVSILNSNLSITKSSSECNQQQCNPSTGDGDDTHFNMSSPTRLLSTPSSIGAAKCLLQLAHR